MGSEIAARGGRRDSTMTFGAVRRSIVRTLLSGRGHSRVLADKTALKQAVLPRPQTISARLSLFNSVVPGMMGVKAPRILPTMAPSELSAQHEQIVRARAAAADAQRRARVGPEHTIEVAPAAAPAPAEIDTGAGAFPTRRIHEVAEELDLSPGRLEAGLGAMPRTTSWDDQSAQLT